MDCHVLSVPDNKNIGNTFAVVYLFMRLGAGKKIIKKRVFIFENKHQACGKFLIYFFLQSILSNFHSGLPHGVLI
jgi:hypothetical protein